MGRSAFKETMTFNVRKAQAAKTRATYAGKVPVILELHDLPGTLGKLPKAKYLVADESTVGSLRAAVRLDAKLGNVPLYLYAGAPDVQLDDATPARQLDAAHCDEDGFLYVRVSSLAPHAISAAGGDGAKRSVPYIRGLLSRVGVGGGSTTAATPAPDAPGFVSPHGDRAPVGASISSCTFLNPRASGKLLPELRPSCGGRVPRALYLAILLDTTAVGLVVPLLVGRRVANPT